MKLLEDTNAAKLRGGFYTPDRVVDECLDRLTELRPMSSIQSVLEPSAGDGAFVAGLGRRADTSTLEVTAVELDPSEAEKCRQRMESAQLEGIVENSSFFKWVESSRASEFDALVGNPPFVRYQFVDLADRRAAERILSQHGVRLQGVSNLWIGFVLVGLRLLKPGGAFALVLPAELLATVSAAQVRELLVSKFDKVRVDLYPRETFPDILQDVMVISGVRADRSRRSSRVRFVEHDDEMLLAWDHLVEADGESWTRFLLTTEEYSAFTAAQKIDGFRPLGVLARVQVSVVTGANAFFTVPTATVKDFSLDAWSLPLLARSEDAVGVIYGKEDQLTASSNGKRVALLHFSSDKPDPLLHNGARTYLASGEDKGLHSRYKCQIREPWYRVPHVKRGSLLLSKRSHQHHRLILNEVGAFTTDTIYRGEMNPAFVGRERDLVAGFHNSMTLLSAEVEGRSYGGGVLELVPSEIARLSVPLLDMSKELEKLDEVSRVAGGQKDTSDALVQATDTVLSERSSQYRELHEVLSSARLRLRDRRLSR